ncbi:MAG TPA: malonic semialdehyde reductase [Armatimonadota bacterium]
MSQALNSVGLDLLFREAHTHTRWLETPVNDDTLRALYDLLKWAPTSMNCLPVRILFLRTPAAKQRLLPALAEGNIEKTMSAPVTAILGYDYDFFAQMPLLFPQHPTAREMFADAPALTETTAKRNGTLQGGYFILAARALGLDCGPMSGFDNVKVDEEFFCAGKPIDPNEKEFFTTGSVRSNFLCNLGYGDPAGVYPRNPRLEFDEVCKLL